MTSFLLHPDKTDRRATFASLVVAFAIAALFYKFGSFALECLAFLATWALIDLPLQAVVRLTGGRAGQDRPAG